MAENKQNNFQNFIQLQKQIIESIPKDNTNHGNVPTSLTLDELFEFLEQHFNEFYEIENLNAVIPFLHRCLKFWAKRDFFNDDIGLVLSFFLEQHKDNEKDLSVSVQIIYQVLNSIRSFENKEITVARKAFVQLITLLPEIKNRNLISSATACLQLYIKMFPENIDIMQSLWSNLSQRLEIKTNSQIAKDTEIDILIQLFDELYQINSNIHDEPTIVATIQQLLKSDERRHRKCGYYLFKKMLQCLSVKFSSLTSIWLSTDQCQKIGQSWRLYITILENLEENQSHLILPSLKNLQELIRSKQLQSSWLDILYLRILTHNNNLVLRWAVEFFLQTFICSDLTTDTLKYLLETTNSNLLYNYEGYFMNLEYFSSFLKGDLIQIYTIMGDINWKPIALYVWLEKLNEQDLPKSISYEIILKISSRVRALQNCTIRQKTIAICNKLFMKNIKIMSMEEYVKYVETLYNSKDEYKEHEIVYTKKSSLVNAKKDFAFSKRFYDIFGNIVFKNELEIDFDIQHFLDFLNDIPIQQHGYLRFLPFHSKHSNDESIYSAIKKIYNLDINSLKYFELADIISTFKKCLLKSSQHDKHELTCCRLTAISFYIYQKDSSLLHADDATFGLIFEAELSESKLYYLSVHLYNIKKQLNAWIIDEFINRICDANVADNVVRYLNENYDANVRSQYIQRIWGKYPQYLQYNLNIIQALKLPNQTRFFYGDVKKGESRIEQLFNFHQFGEYKSDLYMIKDAWFFGIELHGDKDYILYLLKCHKELTEKKPRYFENSNEHRFKLRIAIAILKYFFNAEYICEEIFYEIWNILINENNQLNISYIYEFIIGSYDIRENVIVEKLNEAHSLTSRQQISIISVVYTFCMRRKLNAPTEDTIISNLLALTMGANFQTRLFAQMVLFKLLNNKFERTSNRSDIIKSIQNATGKKFDEYFNDIRIHMQDIAVELYDSKISDIIHVILCVTNAPFDEIIQPNFTFDNIRDPLLQTQIIKCRENFLKKSKSSTEEEANLNSDLNDQLQRKMNPVNDVTEPNNLILYPIEEKSAEMFVIASLINKLPNLGGIARTCEVLGINNLVLDTRKHIEKSDFKNLSMTAENSLNIIEVKPKDLKEFLINKQLQGFKIVGAEQTSNSQNFRNFKFPDKCILLLGHEKDGIPAPLLGLLDYAVEIPQFGQVRSLNVHVTGALFMWEYCKQHLL